MAEPCHTLLEALLKVKAGGKVYLDGRGSESNPYSCEKTVGQKKLVLKRIGISLTIQGWQQRPILPANYVMV